MIHRRDFLAASAFALSQSLATGAAEKRSVIVIGAGVAGLAAAANLKAAGFAVTVVEARDRIGGRIQTDTSLGLAADLGASWIHGITDNPVTALAKESKIKYVETDFDAVELYGVAGKPFAAGDVKKALGGFEKARKALHKAARAGQEESLVKPFAAVLELFPAELRPLVRWQLFSEIESSSGADAAELSLLSYDHDLELDGPEVVFPDGYQWLPKALAQGVDVKLKCQVTAVEVTATGVVLSTSTGEMKADYALVTLPLGVLQSGKVKFRPGLAEAKQAAIRRINAGRFCKIFATFEKPFWPEKLHRFASVREPFAEIMSMLPTHGKPVLTLLTGGAYAKKIERMTNAEAKAEMMARLRETPANVPDARQILVTRWGEDEHTLGAFASLPPGAKPGDYEVLAAPEGSRLFFAGEATSQQFPGTVHGALLSGRREAKRIRELQ